MINFILRIIVGTLIGWLASIVMPIKNRQRLITDIIAGIIGAFAGGYFLSYLFKINTASQGGFSGFDLLVSLGGAVIVLVISWLFRLIGEFLQRSLFFSSC